MACRAHGPGARARARCFTRDTGEFGGQWRYRGRPPQRLVGVGFTAQGSDASRPYRRLDGSFDPRARWIFEGVGDDELIGDFGLVMGAAGGAEIDRADAELGTPPHALLLARADGYTDMYAAQMDDSLFHQLNEGGTTSPLVRADMVFFETPGRSGLRARLDLVVRQPFPRRLREQRLAHHRERSSPVPRPGSVSRAVVTQTVVEYDPTGRATQADPYPAYRLLLEHAPVYRNQPRDFYALSRYADVQSAFRDWRTFSNAGGVTVDELLALTGPSFLTMDPPRHDLVRAVVREPFRPKALAALEERIRVHACDLLDPLEGEVEMMTAFAERLPVLVVCELLGFPLADELVLKSWSNAILERVPDDDRTPDAARTAAGAMREYFVEQLANRRRHPGMDILSLLVTARPGGEPLPHEELVGTCFLLFEAGNSTTTALLGTSILLLGPEPAQRRWFARNPGGRMGAIEELLRFESPVRTWDASRPETSRCTVSTFRPGPECSS